MELHKEHGGKPEEDIPFQYLSFFLDDDEEISRIEKEYRAGTLSTGDLKKRCIEVLQKFVGDFQAVSFSTIGFFFPLLCITGLEYGHLDIILFFQF